MNNEHFTKFAEAFALAATAPTENDKKKVLEILQELSYFVAMSDIQGIKAYLIEDAIKKNASKKVIDNLKSFFPTTNGSIL